MDDAYVPANRTSPLTKSVRFMKRCVVTTTGGASVEADRSMLPAGGGAIAAAGPVGAVVFVSGGGCWALAMALANGDKRIPTTISDFFVLLLFRAT
jgi:hypothetical protein